MTWKQTDKLKNTLSISYIESHVMPWVIRGFNDVYVMDPVTGKSAWNVKLEGDHTFGYKSVIVTDDAVVVSAHRNENPKDVRLMAFSLNMGKPLWERKIAWGLGENFGGLLQKGPFVVFIEKDTLVPELLIMEAATGKVVQKVQGIMVPASGVTQQGPYSAVIAGDHAYFCSEQGLYKAVIGISKPTLSLVKSEKPEFISAASGQICLLESESYDVVLIDGHDQRELGRVLLPEPLVASNLILCRDSHNNAQAIVLLKEGQGMALVDFKKGKVLWQAGYEEKWHISNAIMTPHCLVIAIFQGGHRQVLCLDCLTGSKMAEMKPEQGIWLDMMHWRDGKLLIDNTQGAHIFQWQ